MKSKASFFGMTFILFFFSILFFHCEGSLQQQSVTVTGSIIGEDGAYTPVDPVNLTLTHIPNGVSSARVIESGTGIQNQQALKLSVNRTGIPLTEEYWFMNISRMEPRPGSELPMPVQSTGDFLWLQKNVGDLAILGLRPDQLDSPLSDSLSFDPTSWLRLSGNSYLNRVHSDDILIPFSDPTAVIDVSRLTSGIAAGFSSIITEVVDNLWYVTPGGSDGAGDITMYFVPHILHSTLTLPARNVKGIGLVLRFTANVTIGINITEFKVYIPISILMEPVPATGGGQRYDVFLDPFSLIGALNPPDNLNRITVTASGLFDQAIANTVRTQIVDAINNMSTADLENLELLAEGLAALINSFRQANTSIPGDWDIIFLPPRQLRGGVHKNIVSPAPDGIEINLLILES